MGGFRAEERHNLCCGYFRPVTSVEKDQGRAFYTETEAAISGGGVLSKAVTARVESRGWRREKKWGTEIFRGSMGTDCPRKEMKSKRLRCLWVQLVRSGCIVMLPDRSVQGCTLTHTHTDVHTLQPMVIRPSFSRILFPYTSSLWLN